MDKRDYIKLQDICDYKIREARIKFPGSTNRQEGWEEAFLSMKSILSTQFKPKEE